MNDGVSSRKENKSPVKGGKIGWLEWTAVPLRIYAVYRPSGGLLVIFIDRINFGASSFNSACRDVRDEKERKKENQKTPAKL